MAGLEKLDAQRSGVEGPRGGGGLYRYSAGCMCVWGGEGACMHACMYKCEQEEYSVLDSLAVCMRIYIHMYMYIYPQSMRSASSAPQNQPTPPPHHHPNNQQVARQGRLGALRPVHAHRRHRPPQVPPPHARDFWIARPPVRALVRSVCGLRLAWAHASNGSMGANKAADPAV